MDTEYNIKTFKTIKTITIKATRRRLRSDAMPANGPTVAAAMLRAVIDMERDIEQFGALYLDRRNNPIGAALIAIGGRAQCPVDITEIFRPAVIIGAVGLIVGHNHPSGDATPSREDWTLTNRVKVACSIFQMDLIDHIILTDERHTSMAAIVDRWSASKVLTPGA